MPRRDAESWPSLGYRFEELRHQHSRDGVYSCEAHDLLLDRRVTVRTPTRHAAPHERELLQREADALTLIGGHPDVVTLLDRYPLGDAEVLVLERGEAVEPAAGLAPAAAVALVVRLAGAVETAHRAGLVHGGIEPEQVQLAADGSPLLAGFAGRLDDPQPPVLRSVTAHTAPEVLLGETPAETTDVYGLGSTLYSLLAGHAAYRSFDGESVAALSLRILTGPVPPIDRPELPFALLDIVTWTMAIDPANRPPSASWLAEELGRIERSQGWPRTPIQVGVPQAGPLPLQLHPDGPRHRAG